MSSTQLDLRKTVELVLTKKGFADDIVARVGIILDESGSMGHLFRNGYVSRTADRALSVGYKFDDNGEIDMWSFSSRFVRREPARQDDFGSAIKHSMLNGSTVYHDVLQDAANFYFKPKVKTSMFGFRKTVEENDNTPAFVMFVTDGQPDDEREAMVNIGRILRENPRMFVQFIGLGYGSFPVLERLAAENPNAAFATIGETDSDEEVLDKFLNEKARAVLERKD